MPVLDQDDVGKFAYEPIDGRDDRVAVGHGKCAARAEVILHVRDDQSLAMVTRTPVGAHPCLADLSRLTTNTLGRRPPLQARDGGLARRYKPELSHCTGCRGAATADILIEWLMSVRMKSLG
jgi:hypothetical protein